MTMTNGEANGAAEPCIGHNKPELTEDEQRVLLYQHKSQYEAALAAKKRADADLKATCKRAKVDCGEHAVADIKELIALENEKGGEALQADIERKLRLARWAGAKVGHQFNFDEDVADQTQLIFEAGKIAGLKGEPRKPPHDPGTPGYDFWMNGYNEGQTVFATQTFKKPDDQMDLSERRDLTDGEPVMVDPPLIDASDPPFGVPPDQPQ
jgi:hypothetical protein